MLWSLLFALAFIFDNQRSIAATDETSLSKTIENGIFTFTVNFGQLLQNEAKDDKNILFSPLNLYAAFALVHLGTNGITRKELSQFMGLPTDKNLVSPIHVTLNQTLMDILHSEKAEVEIANAIFVQKGFQLKQTYVILANSLYSNNVQNVDFVKEPQKTLDTVNQWISQSTKERINKLFLEPFSGDTVSILASTLYFSGVWETKFMTPKTKLEKFHTADNKLLDVQMMNAKRTVPYFNNSYLEYEALILPYEGHEFSMYFVLPYANQTLKSLTAKLDAENLQLLLKQNITLHKVRYKIPKIKFNWKGEIVEKLKSLGLQSLFHGADLSNMFTATDVDVSKVTHATEIVIAERGTNATASTSLDFFLRTGGDMIPKPDDITFYLDRPFLFYIYHHKTNSILFAGSVSKP